MTTDSPAVREPAAGPLAAIGPLAEGPIATRDSRWKRAVDLLAAEWIKLSGARSTWLIVALGLLGSIGSALLYNNSTVGKWDGWEPAERAAFDPLAASFSGFALLQLALTAVGALTMGREYSSGLIRTTFTAAPARRAVLAAKAATVGALAAGVGLAASLTTFTVSQAMFAEKHFGLSLGSPGALRAILASSLHLAGVTLVGLALAALLRHGAGAVTACFGFLFLAPVFLQGDRGWLLRVHQSLMDSAVRHLTVGHVERHGPSTPGAWAVLVITPLVLLSVAAVVIDRRDV
ncbi:ABC transporter permease [Kitasatospora xanthocidica]|uniref:ABC transporter permease n=1 Tax=Kitasatospora xanthocidica TaxID=83382 RepID=A0A372ZU66_9ACTN|nr:ABC transporter permease [Kitasatospora xanthocidica]RGD59281.1 ABC transporter permease [Kitasatospora xanthocidica]